MKDRSKKGVFFKIMGLGQIERDDVWIRTKTVKEVMKAKKARKRREKRLINLAKAQDSVKTTAKRQINDMLGKERKTKNQKISEQIQNGFDLAKRLMQNG